MAGSESELLYSEREEWRDVTPIPQDDGPHPVVPIAYSTEFRDAMDYFRGVMARGEKSARALRLTTHVIRLNAANYTVWHFRRLVLESISADLEQERMYLDTLATETPKNYQLWYHRRWVAEKLGQSSAEGELALTAEVLNLDAKNYHAWSHRQWVLRELGGWENELLFCEELLKKDVRNNSAWNQRFFVITQSPLLGGLAVERKTEVQFCAAAIRKAPSNESPWRYLRGLYGHDFHLLVKDSQVVALCGEVLASHPQCVHALALCLDLLPAGLRLEPLQCELLHISTNPTAGEAVGQLCDLLTTLDPIRAHYWEHRKGVLLDPC